MLKKINIKNNLRNEILKYFLLFSVLILSMLWLFQILFFKSFYREQKINDINYVASTIKKNKYKTNFEETINNLAFDKSVCIEIADNNYDILYNSIYFGKGCISGLERTYNYKAEFINNSENEKSFEITNPKFNNQTIIHAIKLGNGRYAFINTSLDPVDGITNLIKKQLIVITILVLILSYVLAHFISIHISNPIKDINSKAKCLAKGNFNVEFENNNKILEIEELSNTLNYARCELNKTEELRRDLMANVSHDLKTPLTMIKAYAEMAKDLHINKKDKQINDMETIIAETDRLTILVNDILDLSKMESIKEKLNITEFNLIELVNEILNRYNVLEEIEKYNFQFTHNKKEIIVKADKKRIEQVIYNLINNAINYTGNDNKIIIDIESNKNIIVKITDTGKGIKEEDIPYIWNKYYKNKKKHKRNLVGTGLGLNIVKNILEQHNYKYGVNSKINKGTTFWFEIKE